MARYDIRALRYFKQAREENEREFREFLERYHSLANIHGQLRTDADRLTFVKKDPLQAAKMFYYLEDQDLGRMLVDAYGKSEDGTLAQLAEGVESLLEMRAAGEEMQGVPSLGREDRDDLFIQGLVENVERAIERIGEARS